MAGAAVEITKDTITPMLRAAVEDASPAARVRLAKNLGVLGLQEHVRYFEREQSPAGRPWRNLSPTTLKRRYAKTGKRNSRVFTWAILQSSGSLRASISPGRGAVQVTNPSRTEAPGWASSVRGAIRRAGEWGVEFGTNLAYGAAHQFGLPRREATVKAHTRKFKQTHFDLVKRRKVRIASGVAFVRSHKTTLPAVPARPFVGLSVGLIARVLETIRMTFWRDKGGTGR